MLNSATTRFLGISGNFPDFVAIGSTYAAHGRRHIKLGLTSNRVLPAIMSATARGPHLVQRATTLLQTAAHDLVQAMRLLAPGTTARAPACFLSLRGLLSSIQIMICCLVDYSSSHALAEPATRTGGSVGEVIHELMLLQDKVITGQTDSFRYCLEQWTAAGGGARPREFVTD